MEGLDRLIADQHLKMSNGKCVGVKMLRILLFYMYIMLSGRYTQVDDFSVEGTCSLYVVADHLR